eukprot:GHVH01007002.1.p1 GENE.GHVH01007002.1~~GHVH01007002.1.p1  ORF type:complete len:260 (+),score=35.89 GHVH01007002.1:798-1577(+)
MGIFSDYMDVIMSVYGNPNYPDPPTDERPAFAWDPDLIKETVYYSIALIVLGNWVFGWLLSWWEILRVGFVSYDDIVFSGWSDAESQRRGSMMRKIMFTTGFENMSCWRLSLQQMENRYAFQRNRLAAAMGSRQLMVQTSAENLMHSRSQFDDRELRSSVVEMERVREAVTAITMYNESFVKADGDYVFCVTDPKVEQVVEPHSLHNLTLPGVSKKVDLTGLELVTRLENELMQTYYVQTNKSLGATRFQQHDVRKLNS